MIIYNDINNCYLLSDLKIAQLTDTCSVYVDMLAPDVIIRDISFPSDNLGFLIDSNGKMYKYVDDK